MKRVGILTSGGDCQALNATMRGVGKGLYNELGSDVEIYGFEEGYKGLIYNEYRLLTARDFSGILTRGGTILGSSRQSFKNMRIPDENGLDKVAAMKQNYRRLDLDCLVILGGNGTQKTANLLCEEGLNIIHLPKTIDNDIWGTDMTFGFQSAVDIATNCIDCIHTTAASHGRVFIVEVMGHKVGWLTLHAGIAGGADIVLIPEIALTYQTLLRFYQRFGDRVSVMNSTLSPGEKYDQCERAKAGEIDVIIGPRSALFTPFPNLGLIVMDEEQENSYKSESTPKYHARETAMEVAKLYGASVVLGSATPSLEAYYRAGKGEYRLFHLTKRLTGGELPTVHTVDLRQELKEGNRSIFSRKLQELMTDRLSRGQQTILFLNRRGYAGFVSCRACGEVMKCPHCDVSLSEHKGGRLICHYCGYTQPLPKLCPKCGSKYILGFKAGTQQIEDKLKELYPGVRTLRMDADTTRTKDSYEKILSSFANGEADVLIGTQMIVKGHDFPKVTLVGILAADLSLNASDYRAGERTFQLLTQAVGRAGRGVLPGEAVIQTYQPDHYAITCAAAQDYESFYQEEILYRELSGYPPVAHMLAVQIYGKEEENVKQLALRLTDVVKSNMDFLSGKQKEQSNKKIQVLGPAPANISKINDIYRYVFYVKHAEYDVLVEVKDRLEETLRQWQSRQMSIQFDFDPVSVL